MCFFIKLNIYSYIHQNLLHSLQTGSRYCTKQQTEMHVAHGKKNAQQIIFHKHRVTYLLFIIARWKMTEQEKKNRIREGRELCIGYGCMVSILWWSFSHFSSSKCIFHRNYCSNLYLYNESRVVKKKTAALNEETNRTYVARKEQSLELILWQGLLQKEKKCTGHTCTLFQWAIKFITNSQKSVIELRCLDEVFNRSLCLDRYFEWIKHPHSFDHCVYNFCLLFKCDKFCMLSEIRINYNNVGLWGNITFPSKRERANCWPKWNLIKFYESTKRWDMQLKMHMHIHINGFSRMEFVYGGSASLYVNSGK